MALTFEGSLKHGSVRRFNAEAAARLEIKSAEL
jgi:hypothetical protein